MNLRKNRFNSSHTINLVLCVLFLCFISCSDKKQFERETQKQSFTADKFEVSLLDKYGFSGRVSLSGSELSMIEKSLRSTSKSYREVEHLLNKETVEVLKNEEGTIAVLFHYSKDENKYYFVRGVLSNENFYLNNELFARYKINKDITTIDILNSGGEGLTVKSDNLKGTISVNPITNLHEAHIQFNLIKDCDGNHGGNGWCQREPGESFSSCYNAEMDEMCNSFWGCVGSSTPFAAVLVASACSCSASTNCS